MERLNFAAASPGAYKAMGGLEQYVNDCSIEPGLLKLVKLRSSQINGCAFCVDMHAMAAGKSGETERRLYALPVWRESPLFTPRERAALAWTELLTNLPSGTVGEQDYAALQLHFDERGMVDLTVAINAINGWNRLAVAFAKQIPA
ncbi:carboxymuconolactone decarboxylase family protein [Duganella sp. FT92W]|uniref:Carboxymuconolactone decarboxylase family protein n=1 Tax=Pseudoduganella rivuli TaxID=2666085 RepID=A0A7X2LT18_9BURK|nr:carboxymuconolactone decarboxylase family protein [Pseudoduganella rivuli]MRV74100.1 carboxymuconolactone decarboxylase family protein [Pseudoduganella rivuli]